MRIIASMLITYNILIHNFTCINNKLGISYHFNCLTNSWPAIYCHFCRYWLSVGAQPSDPVQRILFRAGLLPPPPMLAMARKGGPRDTRPIDPMTGRYLKPDSPESIDQLEEGEGEVNEETDNPASWNSVTYQCHCLLVSVIARVVITCNTCESWMQFNFS